MMPLLQNVPARFLVRIHLPCLPKLSVFARPVGVQISCGNFCDGQKNNEIKGEGILKNFSLPMHFVVSKSAFRRGIVVL